jgi:hypothetical protein
MEEAKMPIEIRETIVTPADNDLDVVQLHISDAPPGDESATFVVHIQMKQRALQTPTLAQLQRVTMKAAQDALMPILQGLAQEMQKAGQGDAPFKNPKRS